MRGENEEKSAHCCCSNLINDIIEFVNLLLGFTDVIDLTLIIL